MIFSACRPAAALVPATVPAAASAMHWGEPILETAITEIHAAGARAIASILQSIWRRDGYSFEAVAEYLWTGQLVEGCTSWSDGARARPQGLPQTQKPQRLALPTFGMC